MLSLEQGNPIARIDKSRAFKKRGNSSKYLGIVMDDDYSPDYELDPYQMIQEDDIEKQAGTKMTKYVRKHMKKAASEVKNVGKEFILNDGVLLPTPDVTCQRDVIYVSGPSNSGKSTFISKYLDEYKEIYPERNAFLFSAVTQDVAFDGKVTRVNLLDEPVDIRDLQDSIAIFDDVDVISNKQIRDWVIALRDACLETGRHLNITTCCTSHQICNNLKTKILLQEATKVVVFPRSGSTYHITRFLKCYCGFTTPQINKFLSLPSRWVMVSKTYPQYVLYNDGAYML